MLIALFLAGSQTVNDQLEHLDNEIIVDPGVSNLANRSLSKMINFTN